MYSTINKTKFGDCCQCGAKETNVVKVAKSTYCMFCHQSNKGKKQLAKQKEVSSIRSLIGDKVNQESSLSYLIADLDTVVSRYVRIREATSEGIVTCFTCDATGHFSLFDAGHFISRSHLATRWLTNNLKIQCHDCNRFKAGNINVYAKRLGEEIVNFLQEASREVYKPSQDELKGMILDYRMKLKLVESKLKK